MRVMTLEELDALLAALQELNEAELAAEREYDRRNDDRSMEYEPRGAY